MQQTLVFYMRFPTPLGLLDIDLLIFSIFMMGLMATTEVKLNDPYLPTAINGISTVTGILVAIRETLQPRKWKFFCGGRKGSDT